MNDSHEKMKARLSGMISFLKRKREYKTLHIPDHDVDRIAASMVGVSDDGQSPILKRALVPFLMKANPEKGRARADPN